MVKTVANKIPQGMQAPDFNLFDTLSGKYVSLNELKSDVATVVMFLCNHCPYVQHIERKLLEIATLYQAKQIAFIAISSNDVTLYPADSPEKMQALALEHHYPFPYLYDESQEVAKAFDAACTPDFYVFDQKLHCVYHGRFDAATPGNSLPVTGESLTQALDCILANKPVNHDQEPSLGCNIKWKK